MKEAHQLYRPMDQIVVTKCNHEQVPIPENVHLHFREDAGNIQVRGVRSPIHTGFFVENECLPMYNLPLIEYRYRYYRYDLNLPTADRRGIGGMRATQFNLLDIPVANFQSFGGCDSTAHELRCTDDLSFHNAARRNNIVCFEIDEPPKSDVGDLRQAQFVKILWLQDHLQKRCVVLFRELQGENQGVCLPSNGLRRVSSKVFCRNQPDLVVVDIECIWAAVHLIWIPSTRY